MGVLLSVPVGSILFYYAEAQNETLPSTYAYCQGQTLLRSAGQHDLVGTDSLLVPDMRNRYLLGADRTKAPNDTGSSANSSAGAPGVATNVGLNLHTLTISHLPDHTHSASMGTGVQSDLTTAATSHGHTITVSALGISHQHSPLTGSLLTGNSVSAITTRGGGASGDFDGFPSVAGDVNYATATLSEGDHSHGIGIVAGGAHTHALTVNQTGGGAGFDGRPLSFALVHIMKVSAMGLLSYPLKTVLVYRADQANETLPDGFAWCDGTTYNSSQQDINPGGNFVSPDLRNRVIIGADVINKVASTSGATGDTFSDAPGVKAAFGSHTTSISSGQMPTHVHDPSQGTIANHDHGGSAGSTNTTGAHTHAPGCSRTYLFYGFISQSVGTSNTGATNTAQLAVGTTNLSTTGDHSHAASSDSQGSHYHAISVSNAGSGSTWDRRPLFYGLIFAMKVKN